ncbi:GNAT family N-acetyltransferase [Burkholderia sp. Ac-20344]|uniref:GNAT family N-acetyltransferase n=1 Tax=Burkholderia sp. Ac-20344 TaxID=2703890 RepID=UPI00197BB083|nr:GNAT family N-acetyltransferase [Burkholderia sp. Ac-20344]
MNTRIWGEFVSKRGALIAIAIVAGTMPGYASAEIKCQSVDFKVGRALNSTWGKQLHHLQSRGGVDNTVNSLCRPNWVHADDYWLYGNYYPLHGGKTRMRGDDARQFVGSNRQQPELSRYLCKDTGENGTIPFKKATSVGVFAYETRDTDESQRKATDIARQVELHVLCVAPDKRGKGRGVEILNEAVRHMTEGIGDDKKVRIQLTSHTKAQRFYDKLDMTCRAETTVGGNAHIYERTLGHRERIETRSPIYYRNWRNGECKRVTFGCGNRSDYEDLKKQAFDSDERYDEAVGHGYDKEVFFIGDWAGNHGCDAKSNTIPYGEVSEKLGEGGQ